MFHGLKTRTLDEIENDYIAETAERVKNGGGTEIMPSALENLRQNEKAMALLGLDKDKITPERQ